MNNSMLGAAVIVSALLLFVQAASAAGFDMEVKLFQPVSTCPTILEDTPPLNKNDMPVFITNFLDRPDTYSLSLSLPKGWNGFISPDFFVKAGETKLVDPFWITVPDVAPGVYKISVNAKSGLTGEKLSQSFEIEVLSCHAVDVDAPEKTQEICSENLETIKYAVKVTNAGKVAETFQLAALHRGKEVAWANVEPKSIALNSGQSKEVTVAVSPPADVKGEQEIVVSARSRTSSAVGSDTVKLRSADCFSFAASLSPESKKLCLGEEAEFTVKVENLGGDNSYIIDSSGIVTVQDRLSLKKGETKQVAAKVRPVQTGKSEFTIIIASEKNRQDVRKLTGTVETIECRDIAVVISPVQSTVCSGSGIDYDVIVKNTGSLEETVTLKTDTGSLAKAQVTLKPGATETVKLHVTTNFTGTRTVNVRAEGKTVTDKTFAIINAENCYASSLSISPEKAIACGCDTVDFELLLKNTGKLADKYTVSFGNSTQQVELATGQERKVSYSLPIPCDSRAGERSLEATASSSHVTLRDSATLSVKETKACYSSALKVNDSVTVETAKSTALPVAVKNTGERKNSFTFKLTGPAWVYLEPAEVTLESNEERNIYLYISPPIETKEGRFDIEVESEGKFTEGKAEVDIAVRRSAEYEAAPATAETKPPEKVAEEKKPEPEKNATIKPAEQKGVTLNASIVNQTAQAKPNITAGNVTGRFPALQSSELRIAAVILITIIIIAVLIIRFVTLSK